MSKKLSSITFEREAATLFDTVIYNKASGNGDSFVIGHLSKYTLQTTGISGDTFNVVGSLNDTDFITIGTITANGFKKDATLDTYVKELRIDRTAGSNTVTIRLVGKTF